MAEEPFVTLNRRLSLNTLLEGMVDHVYFQPPPNYQMQYPCIVYNLDDIETLYADNKPYRHMKQYQVTVIDSDPDSQIPGKIADLPLCGFDRHFTSDNLNHFVYNLFF